jgi:hypothetical protein
MPKCLNIMLDFGASIWYFAFPKKVANCIVLRRFGGASGVLQQEFWGAG